MPGCHVVAFVTDLPPPRTGQSLITASFLRRLRDRGMDVRHIPLTGATDLQPGKAKKVRLFLRNLIRVTRCLRGRTSDRIDTAYLVCPSTTGGAVANLVVAALCPRTARVVVHVHNGDFGRLFQSWRRPLGWLIGRLADVVVFSAPDLAARVPLPSSKVAHVSNPIGIEFEAALARPSATPPTDQDGRVLTVGFLSNFIPEKGYQVVADAVVELCLAGRDVRLEMWGAWPSPVLRAEFLRLLSSEPPGASCVRVHPPLTTDADVVAALRSVDVLVLPTTYPREAHPLSIIEALAAGVPVIASRHASIPSMLRDGETGFLIPVPPSSNEVRKKLEVLLSADRAAMSAAARSAFETRHQPDLLTDQLAAVLCPRMAAVK